MHCLVQATPDCARCAADGGGGDCCCLSRDRLQSVLKLYYLFVVTANWRPPPKPAVCTHVRLVACSICHCLVYSSFLLHYYIVCLCVCHHYHRHHCHPRSQLSLFDFAHFARLFAATFVAWHEFNWQTLCSLPRLTAFCDYIRQLCFSFGLINYQYWAVLQYCLNCPVQWLALHRPTTIFRCRRWLVVFTLSSTRPAN